MSSQVSSSTSSVTCRLSEPLPTGTIDAHTHIIPPDFAKYPTIATAEYEPHPHTIDDAIAYYARESGLGIAQPRMVLTQVSIYGTDNSGLLSGLNALEKLPSSDSGQDGSSSGSAAGSRLGNLPNARGVVDVNPHKITAEELQHLWSVGATGIRINLVSVSRSITEPDLEEMLQAYISKLAQAPPSRARVDDGSSQAPPKWSIELYIPLSYSRMLSNVLSRLEGADSIRWCVAHFGGLKFPSDAPQYTGDESPYTIAGFQDLVNLITNPDGNLPECYVKLSAPYRVDKSHPSEEALKRLDSVGRELVTRAENRVVWASDWPHTRFDGVDTVPFVEACYKWCGTEEKRRKLFRTNAERLFSMS